MDVLTQAVVGKLRGILSHPAAIEGMLAEAEAMYRAPDDAAAQIEALAAQVDKLDAELARLAEAVATGGAVPAVMTLMKAKQAACDQAAADLAHLESVERGPGFNREDWTEFLRQVVAGLDQVLSLEPQPARQVLRRILGGTALVVEIGPKGVFRVRGEANVGAAADFLLADLSSTSEHSAWRL